MNIKEIIIKGLDWLGKFFKRFKAFGYLVVIIAMCFFFVNNGIKKNQAIKLAERILHLDLEKEVLLGQKNELSIERDSLKKVNFILKESRDSLIVVKNQYHQKSILYKRQRNEALEALKFITSDSSYKFLQNIAYPFLGHDDFSAQGVGSLQPCSKCL